MRELLTLQLEERPSERVRVRWNSAAALRSLQWPQTLKATVGSVTSDLSFLRSAAAAAMHSCITTRVGSEQDVAVQVCDAQLMERHAQQNAPASGRSLQQEVAPLRL